MDMTSCHINYLLGQDKCISVDDYIKTQQTTIKALKKKDELEVDVSKYLDLNSNYFTKSKDGVQKSKSRSRSRSNKRKREMEKKEIKDDRAHNECYNPCHHDGDCDEENCECIINGRPCEKFCHCSTY